MAPSLAPGEERKANSEPGASPPLPANGLTGAEESQAAESRRIVRTASALLSGQLITQVASLLSILIVPRVLGAADFGMLATAGAVGSLAATFAVFGTRDFLVKEAARSPEDSANVVANVIVTRIVIWLAVALVLTPLAFWYIDSPTGEKLIVIAILGTSFPLIGEAALGGLQAHHALGRAVVIRSALTMVGRLAAVALLLVGVDVVGFSLTSAVFAAPTALITLYLFWRRFGGEVRLGVSNSVNVIKGGAAFFALEIARITYGAADVLMLAAMTTASTVGTTTSRAGSSGCRCSSRSWCEPRCSHRSPGGRRRTLRPFEPASRTRYASCSCSRCRPQ